MTKEVLETFAEQHDTLRRQIEVLSAWLDTEEQRTVINWSHVGNLVHVNEVLADAVRFVSLPSVASHSQHKVVRSVFSPLTEGIDDGV